MVLLVLLVMSLVSWLVLFWLVLFWLVLLGLVLVSGHRALWGPTHPGNVDVDDPAIKSILLALDNRFFAPIKESDRRTVFRSSRGSPFGHQPHSRSERIRSLGYVQCLDP
jgi:hypothetical protein